MWKIKTFAVITILLGIISLGFIIYDYFALTEIVYNKGEAAQVTDKLRMMSLGFIPIVLFHFSFFVLMYLLFAYLKTQKVFNQEFTQLKTKSDKNNTGPEITLPDQRKAREGEKDYTKT